MLPLAELEWCIWKLDHPRRGAQVSARLCLRRKLTLRAPQAAYCDQGLVAEVIVPLLSMQESVLLCISTLLDGANHYSKMFELQDEAGEPLFKQLAITLVCCLPCESNPLVTPT